MKYTFTFADCTCEPDELYANGAKSEWYKDEALAAKAAISHKMNGTLYWSVHLRGNHILSVRETNATR